MRKRSRERVEGVVLVVIQITDDQVPNGQHLRDLHTFSSVTSHELTIQQSVEGELRQHNGVMTVMMMQPEQGFA